MNVHYSGDSPPKKIARLRFWEAVEDILGAKSFSRGPHLVISSKEGGDISVLLGMGVRADHIIAVDTDPHAVAAARVKFEGVRIERCDFAQMAKENTPLACMFVDLCSPIRSGSLEKIMRASSHCLLFGYEFLCGREKVDVYRKIEKFQGTSQEQRIRYLADSPVKGVHYKPARNWHYLSSTESHIGKPMCITLGSSVQAVRKGPAAVMTSKPVEATWDTIREEALDLEAKGLRADLLLNIKRTTLAAYKAHLTRGTY